MLNEIQQLSSFKKFELETCQLQKIDINSLTTINEKLLFFTNIYNMLVGKFLAFVFAALTLLN